MANELLLKGTGGSQTQSPYPLGVSSTGQFMMNSAGTILGVNPFDSPAQSKSGFVNRTDSSIAITAPNFEIATGSSYDFYLGGVKFTKSAPASVPMTDHKQNYVWFDAAGTLTTGTTEWGILDFVSVKAPVSSVYRDGANYILYDERHACRRDIVGFHVEHHYVEGCEWRSGFEAEIAWGATFQLSQGTVMDEDLLADSLVSKTSGALMYRNAAPAPSTYMVLELGATTPYKAIAGVLQYDQNGVGLTPLSNGQRVNTWIYATNSPTYPIHLVIGQNLYSTQALADDEPAPALPEMTTREWKLIYRVTYRQTAGGPVFGAVSDYRQSRTGPAAGTVSGSHAALTDRSVANQHPVEAIGSTVAYGMTYTDASGTLAVTLAATNYQILQGVTGGVPTLTDTPQFPRIGIGAAADATIPLYVSSGIVGVGGNTNALMTTGVHIDQSTADNIAFAVGSSTDVDHGMTALAPTEVYFSIQKKSATAGVPTLRGFADAGNTAIEIAGYYVTDSTDHAKTGYAAVVVTSGKKSGTSVAAPGADANIFGIEDSGSGRVLLVDKEGQIHINETSTDTFPTIDMKQSSTGDVGDRLSLGNTISYMRGIDNSVNTPEDDPYVLATAASAAAALGTGNIWIHYPSGSVQSGPDGAAATDATNGLFYVRTCAGTPVGDPTDITGYGAVIIDSTNHKLCFNDGSGWISVP